MPLLGPSSNDLHRLSDTQSILMYHSVVKVKKILGLSFSKLSLILYAKQVQVMLLASNNICLYFQKSSDTLNKNTLGVKKVRGQSEAALQTGATKNFDIS